MKQQLALKLLLLRQTSLLIQQSTVQISGHGHPLMSHYNLF